MKKMFWMLGVAVAALTSCTNDEVVEVNQSNLIKFESFVNKGTRAVTETTKNGLTKFYVFGYHNGDSDPVFSNDYVQKNNNDWSNEVAKNWTANTYYFGAYATKNESEKLSTTPLASFSNVGTLTISDYSVGSMDPENHSTDDLIAAVKTVNNTQLTNSAVSLDFKHLLSQVKFEFNNNNEGYFMTVSDIVFKAMPTGNCTIDKEGVISWTLKDGLTSSDSLTYTYPGTGSEVYIPANESFESVCYLVLPVDIAVTTCANFTISFYERVGAEGNYTYNLMQTIPYQNISLIGTSGPTDNDPNNNTDQENVTSWLPGYIYNYKAYFPINPSEIVFTVNTVEDWQDNEVNDNTVNNESVEF